MMVTNPEEKGAWISFVDRGEPLEGRLVRSVVEQLHFKE
jgi:hypothetical protein